MSMANVIRFYESKGSLMLNNAGETANFVEFWNNLFDNFNRNLPWQGLKSSNDEGFQVIQLLINVQALKYNF